jgi:hypothetical protein
MTLDSTLDLLYLVISIAVLWVAAMLTWLLFEAALAMRNANRMIRVVQKKVLWLERTIADIGERLESSAGYLGAAAKGGKMIASFIRERKRSRDSDEDEDEDEENEKPKKKRSKRRKR